MLPITPALFASSPASQAATPRTPAHLAAPAMLAAVSRGALRRLGTAQAAAGAQVAARRWQHAAAAAASGEPDFDLTEEQRQIQQVAQSFAREELAPYRCAGEGKGHWVGREQAMLPPCCAARFAHPTSDRSTAAQPPRADDCPLMQRGVGREAHLPNRHAQTRGRAGCAPAAAAPPRSQTPSSLPSNPRTPSFLTPPCHRLRRPVRVGGRRRRGALPLRRRPRV